MTIIQQSPRASMELAGPWYFQLDQDDRGEAEGWHAAEFYHAAWAIKQVPGAWDWYDPALWSYEGVGWYITEIDAGVVQADRWQQLCFTAVNIHARVWLNGQYLGEHYGGHLPFAFPATPHLRTDGPNVLAVRVDNAYHQGWLPATPVIEWVHYGGILQPVRLITTELVAVSRFEITAAPDGRGAEVACVIEVTNHGEAAFHGQLLVEIPLSYWLSSAHSMTPESGFEVSRATADIACEPGATATANITVSMPSAGLWSPDSPTLYEATATLIEGDHPTDSVSDRFGVRTIAVRGTEILLNGEPLQIKGVSRYDEYGSFGRTVPEELIREDLLKIKQTGVNLIRVHYPQDTVHHRLMDEIGLLLMQEVPLNWWWATPEHSAAQIDAAEQALVDMIARDRNHPCVIAWSMANESKTDSEIGIAAMRRLLRKARALDPTRLLTFVANSDVKNHRAFEEADFIGINCYPGVFEGDLAAHFADMDTLVREPMERHLRYAREQWPDKPIVVTEFGAIGICGLFGDTRYTEDNQAAYLRAAWRGISDQPDIAGGILWCWADYYHQRNFIGSGPGPIHSLYGPYGVVTVDRRPKKSLAELAGLFGGGKVIE